MTKPWTYFLKLFLNHREENEWAPTWKLTQLKMPSRRGLKFAGHTKRRSLSGRILLGASCLFIYLNLAKKSDTVTWIFFTFWYSICIGLEKFSALESNMIWYIYLGVGKWYVDLMWFLLGLFPIYYFESSLFLRLLDLRIISNFTVLCYERHRIRICSASVIL